MDAQAHAGIVDQSLDRAASIRCVRSVVARALGVPRRFARHLGRPDLQRPPERTHGSPTQGGWVRPPAELPYPMELL
jgi:hypothetical protein